MDNNLNNESHKFVHFNNWRALQFNKEALYQFDESSLDAIKQIAHDADDLFDCVAKIVARSAYVPYIAVLRNEFYRQTQHTNKDLYNAQQTLLKLADFAENLLGITPTTNFNEIPQFVDETENSFAVDFKNIDDIMIDTDNCIFVLGDIILWDRFDVSAMDQNSNTIYSLTSETLPKKLCCLTAAYENLTDADRHTDDEKM